MEHTTIHIADGIQPLRLNPDLLPVAAVLQKLGRFERPQLENFIETAISLLDFFDDDPDIEDATDVEDDFNLTDIAASCGGDTPGCSIADPDFGIDDNGEVDRAEDDWFNHGSKGPGCELADNGIADQDALPSM